MKLIPYDKEKLIRDGWYKTTKNVAIIEEFIASGLDCVELTEHGHKKATYCQWCLYNTMKRFKINTVKVITRKGRVFLIRIDESES